MRESTNNLTSIIYGLIAWATYIIFQVPMPSLQPFKVRASYGEYKGFTQKLPEEKMLIAGYLELTSDQPSLIHIYAEYYRAINIARAHDAICIHNLPVYVYWGW